MAVTAVAFYLSFFLASTNVIDLETLAIVPDIRDIYASLGSRILSAEFIPGLFACLILVKDLQEAVSGNDSKEATLGGVARVSGAWSCAVFPGADLFPGVDIVFIEFVPGMIIV